MNKTKIEWTNYTWNPVTGCNKHCDYCYARKIANRFGDKEFKPTFHKNRLNDPHLIKKPSKIFVGSMGEVFDDECIVKGWVARILSVVKANPQHTLQFLTKQPQNLIKFSPYPKNAWVGVSVDDSDHLFDAIAKLLVIDATVKYISFEPLLYWDWKGIPLDEAFKYGGINWVIIGQQTPIRQSTSPSLNWIYNIVTYADRANIPIFLKDNLREKFCVYGYPQSVDWALKRMTMRQEFPKASATPVLGYDKNQAIFSKAKIYGCH
jgi:protein gp37